MFCRSISSNIDVKVSLYTFVLLDWLWYFISPNAIELKLFICSIVYWAYWVKFCLMAKVGVVPVTLGTSSRTTESTYSPKYFCFEGLKLFWDGSLSLQIVCKCFKWSERAIVNAASLLTLDFHPVLGSLLSQDTLFLSPCYVRGHS